MDGRGEDLAFLLLKRGMTRDVVQGPPRGWDFGREKNLVVQVLVALPLSLSLSLGEDSRAKPHGHTGIQTHTRTISTATGAAQPWLGDRF